MCASVRQPKYSGAKHERKEVLLASVHATDDTPRGSRQGKLSYFLTCQTTLRKDGPGM